MDEADAIIERIGAVLADHPVAFAYLFGSVARADARPDSDVDVAIRFEPGRSASERFALQLSIGVDLERALRRAVDVVDLDEVPLRLAGRILTERIVVCGLDRPERVRYETQLFRRYVDFERHAREMDAAMLAAMAAGER